MKKKISKSSCAFFCASFESGTRKKQHVFEPVLDESDHPVRGLWKRGDKFYARLNLRDSVAQSKQRRIPLSSQSVIQAKAELERLKTERHSPKTKKRKTSPLFSEYWPQYLAEVSGIKRKATLNSEKMFCNHWNKVIGRCRIHLIENHKFLNFDPISCSRAGQAEPRISPSPSSTTSSTMPKTTA